jgi:hypothetical protein
MESDDITLALLIAAFILGLISIGAAAFIMLVERPGFADERRETPRPDSQFS